MSAMQTMAASAIVSRIEPLHGSMRMFRTSGRNGSSRGWVPAMNHATR